VAEEETSVLLWLNGEDGDLGEVKGEGGEGAPSRDTVLDTVAVESVVGVGSGLNPGMEELEGRTAGE